MPTCTGRFGDLDQDALVATVTAGWQEREVDDAELAELVGFRTVEPRPCTHGS